jgi:tRNA G10  N-methylase Trm11
MRMPFLVPQESIDSQSFILVLAFGDLSILEAQCVLGNPAIVPAKCGDIAMVDLKQGGAKTLAELAGVHKIALPLPSVSSAEFADAIQFPESNFNFSLSLYCMQGDEDAYEGISQELLATLRDLGLKKANLIRSRSGPELHSERVVARSSMDFVAFPLGATTQWGVTIFVPNTESFKERSNERPYVTSGISLSSRLARLLVNIAGVSKGDVLLDPFCGSGTILGEALLKGVDCIGVDRNHGTVERTKDNLRWLASQNERGGRRLPSFSVKVGDATRLQSDMGETKVDAIVSEPILVPMLSSAPSLDRAKKLIRHASFIYSEALHEMSRVMKRGGRLVLVTPSLRTKEGRDVTLLFDDLREVGLRPFQPGGEFAYEYPLTFSHQSTRWVRRMLYVLERV